LKPGRTEASNLMEPRYCYSQHYRNGVQRNMTETNVNCRDTQSGKQLCLPRKQTLFRFFLLRQFYFNSSNEKGFPGWSPRG